MAPTTRRSQAATNTPDLSDQVSASVKGNARQSRKTVSKENDPATVVAGSPVDSGAKETAATLLDDEGFPIPTTLVTKRKAASRTTGPSSAAPAADTADRSRKAAGIHDPSQSRIFSAIRSSCGEPLSAEIREWSEMYADDAHGAVVFLINLVFEAAGFPQSIVAPSDALEKSVEEVVDETIATLDVKGTEIGEHWPLAPSTAAMKDRRAREFKKHYIEFWKALIQRLEDDVKVDLLKTLEEWLIVLGCSKIRCIRQAGAIAAFGACDGLLSSYTAVSTSATMSKKQMELEKKAKGVKTAAYEEFRRQAENGDSLCRELIRSFTSFLHTVFLYRTRDVSSMIRLDALNALIRWSNTVPERFLASDTYVKLFGYALVDESPALRLASVQYLAEVVETDAAWKALNSSSFIRMFAPQLCDVAHDPDAAIRLAALRCLRKLESESLLSDEQVEDVVESLWNPPEEEDPQALAKLADFIDGAFFSFSVCANVSNEEEFLAAADTAGDAQRERDHTRDLRSILQFALLFISSAPPGMFTERLVRAFWRKATALRNMQLAVDLLTTSASCPTSNEAVAQQPLEEECRVPLLRMLQVTIRLAYEDVQQENGTKKHLRAEKDGEAESSRERFLQYAVVTLFNAIPQLLQICKAEPEVLEAVCGLAFEAAGHADAVREQLHLTKVATGLVETFTHHSQPALVEAAAAAMSKLYISLSPDANSVENVIEPSVHAARTAFASAYDSWKSATVENCNSEGAKEKSLAQLVVSLRRLSAVNRAGISNPFYDHWATFDLLLDLLSSVKQFDGTSQDTSTERSDSPPSNSVILLSSEVLLGGYLHLWCDLVECCYRLDQVVTSGGIMNAEPDNESNAENSGSSEYPMSSGTRKRSGPRTEDVESEQDEGRQNKRRKVILAGVNRLEANMERSLMRRILDQPASRGLAGSAGDSDVGRLCARIQKLLAVAQQLWTNMASALATNLDRRGSKSASDVIIVNSCASVIQLASINKFADCLGSVTDEIASVQWTGNGESLTAKESRENVQSTASAFRAFKIPLSSEVRFAVYEVYRNVLGACSGISTNTVKVLSVTSYYDAPGDGFQSFTAAARFWEAIGDNDVEDEVNRNKLVEARRTVWAADFLSRTLIGCHEEGFWDSQLTSLLISMITEEDRLELQSAAKICLETLKKFASAELVWRRLFNCAKTLSIFEADSLKPFCVAIARNLGIAFYRDTKTAFISEFVGNCLQFVCDELQNSSQTDITPASAAEAIGNLSVILPRRTFLNESDDALLAQIVTNCSSYIKQGEQDPDQLTVASRKFLRNVLSRSSTPQSKQLSQKIGAVKPRQTQTRPEGQRRLAMSKPDSDDDDDPTSTASSDSEPIASPPSDGRTERAVEVSESVNPQHMLQSSQRRMRAAKRNDTRVDTNARNDGRIESQPMSTSAPVHSNLRSRRVGGRRKNQASQQGDLISSSSASPDLPQSTPDPLSPENRSAIPLSSIVWS